MADGPFRFHQGAAQHFLPQPGQFSIAQRQIQARNLSPANGATLGFGTDTPSPSRSAERQSPTLAMYNQGHQQGQNVYLNGNHAHQRYGLPAGVTKTFQNPAPHHQGHPQHRQPQEHVPHTHTSNFANHQHNASTGFPGSQHFNPLQLRNGTPTQSQNGLTRQPNEQWQQQLALAQQAREATGTHPHARNHPPVSKSGMSGAAEVTKKDSEPEPRNRPVFGNEAEKQRWCDLDMGGQGLRAISVQLFDYPFLKKLYLNHNKLSSLPTAIGRLRSLTHLDLSVNELATLPTEMGMLVNLNSLLLFDNNLQTLPYELGALYRLEMLGIEGNPLDENWKSVIMEEGTKALITTLREQAAGPEPPAERPLILLDESKAAAANADAEKFTVFSYNILGDKATTQSYYGYTPQSALEWEHRREVIVGEIRERDADIVCLQEVETENFNEFLRPTLALDDYKGVFFPRTRARTMGDKEAKLVDGCATFYKHSKYMLLDKQFVDFANIAINRPDMKGEHDVFNRVMPRDHIAVVVFLENRITGSRLITVNVHLFWDLQYTDVKVVQTAIMMEWLEKHAEKFASWPPCKDKVVFRLSDDDSGKPSTPAPDPGPSQYYASAKEIPLVIGGDFNSSPKSGVYNLISEGHLPPDHPDLGDYKYGKFTKDGMSHAFSLKSAYSNINELSFTNYVPGFTGVIDYIWYSTPHLTVTTLLGDVDPEYMARVPGFPNYHFPSDHIALMAEFLVKPRKERPKAVEADFGPQQRDRR